MLCSARARHGQGSQSLWKDRPRRPPPVRAHATQPRPEHLGRVVGGVGLAAQEGHAPDAGFGIVEQEVVAVVGADPVVVRVRGAVPRREPVDEDLHAVPMVRTRMSVHGSVRMALPLHAKWKSGLSATDGTWSDSEACAMCAMASALSCRSSRIMLHVSRRVRCGFIVLPSLSICSIVSASKRQP
jgi:hypothetical protein